MTNEQTNTSDTSGNEINKPDKETEKPTESVSIVDEARAIRDEIVKAKEDLQKENDKKERLQSNELSGGNAGGHVEAVPAKEETPKEYNDRIDKELSEGKNDE